MNAFRQGAASSRSVLYYATKYRWQHWLGGATVAVGFNAGLLWAMAEGYRWYYADDQKQQRLFRERYGMPTERQRLEAFAAMSEDWDQKIALMESSGATLYRKEHFAGNLRGDVLEVAVGTGQNFEHLASSEAKSYVGVDIVDAMLNKARPKLTAVKIPTRLEVADAHKLPFPDASFDTVLGSLCLCSVERPAVALSEMARVCRPGGEVLLVEPGVASWWPIRFAQRYLGIVPDPHHVWEANWFDDIDPPALVRACPLLTLASVATKVMGNWYLIRASRRPQTPSEAAPSDAARLPAREPS